MMHPRFTPFLDDIQCSRKKKKVYAHLTYSLSTSTIHHLQTPISFPPSLPPSLFLPPIPTFLPNKHIKIQIPHLTPPLHIISISPIPIPPSRPILSLYTPLPSPLIPCAPRSLPKKAITCIILTTHIFNPYYYHPMSQSVRFCWLGDSMGWMIRMKMKRVSISSYTTSHTQSQWD